jgi:hypothetical protein
MKARTWAAGLLAVGGLCLAATAARAGDTIKLGLAANDDAPAVALGKLSPVADTIDAGFRGGGFHGGGFHGGGFHGGGFHGRGFHGGGFDHGGFRHGGFRSNFFFGGFYGGYYPRYYGFGYGYGYYPRYYGYYPSYYYDDYYYSPYGYPYSYRPRAYFYSAAVLSPVSVSVTRATPSADLLNVPYNGQDILPAPRPLQEGATYPYDGGPRPLGPYADPEPTRNPRPSTVPGPTVPLEGRPVSLPAKPAAAPKLTYPAFGELPRTQFAEDRVLPTKK